MNIDFRVAVDFFTHHKARKLKKRLGASAVLSLLQLWAYAAKLRVDGNLSGMTPEDIELAAEWEGADGALVAALEEIGFIDVRRSSDDRQTNADGRPTIFDAVEIRLHDWAEHNPFVVEAEDRSGKARFSRLATVNRKAFEKLKAQGVSTISKNDYNVLTKPQRTSDGRQTNVDDPSTPSPSPAPAPAPKRTREESVAKATLVPELSGTDAAGGADADADAGDAVDDSVLTDRKKPERKGPPLCPHALVLEAYHELLPELPRMKTWSDDRQEALRTRWREKWREGKFTDVHGGLEYFRKLFAYVRESDFLMGRVEARSRDRPFMASLDWICKRSNFQKIIEGRYHHREAA